MSRAACCAAAEMVLVFAVGMSRAACCAASEMVLLLATLLTATATCTACCTACCYCILLAVRKYARRLAAACYAYFRATCCHLLLALVIPNKYKTCQET